MKLKKIISCIIILIVTIVLLKREITYCTSSFSSYFKDRCNVTKYKNDNFDIKILKYPDLPYDYKQTTISKKEIYDLDSVPLFNLNEKLIYHPVYIAQYALRMLDVYNTTKDSSYLRQVERISDKLLGISIYTNSSLYFPYPVDYSNHPNKYQELYAPWYSGMAQGQTLSLFTRLYQKTKEKKYLNVCHKIFNSFTKLKGDGFEPWTVCVDKENNFWIEEYPTERPCFTLNGMIFGIYGVYDYYRITNNFKAKEILQASITTIKSNIYKYRNSNDISYYCQEGEMKIIDYHTLVIEQLFQLYKITNDKFFLNESINFKSDSENIKISDI